MSKLNEEELLKIKEMWEFISVRQLEDNSVVGIGNLLFTRAIYTNVNLWGFEKRFCFEDRVLADSEFLKLKDMDSEPEGYIARRGN